MCHPLNHHVRAEGSTTVDGGPPILDGITAIPDGKKLTLQVAPTLSRRFDQVTLMLKKPKTRRRAPKNRAR